MIKLGNEMVQAFPIMNSTFVGVANGYTGGGRILHAAEDGTLTFVLPTKNISIDVVAGQDIALSLDVRSITSTGTVWIS